MSTGIDFLDRLGDELLEAAEREIGGRPVESAPAAVVGTRTGGRSARVVAATAIAAAALVVAGVLGHLLTDRRPATFRDQIARLTPIVAAPAAPRRSIVGAPAQAGSDFNPSQRLGSLRGIYGDVPRGAAGSDLSVDAMVPQVGPEIIKTGQIRLQVARGSFSSAFASAIRIAETYGGFVQTSSTEGQQTKSGSVVIRVPAEKFELAVNDLGDLGTIEQKSVHGEDVTAQFVDLGARLRNAQQEEVVLSRLLEKAPTVASTLSVEREVSQVELLIEQLRGQIRLLSNQADYGTIQVDLFEKAPTKTVVHVATHRSFGSAWRRAIDGFFGIATSVVTGLGYVLPILVVMLAAWLLLRRRLRRRSLAG
jgi:hypothetical protein